MVKAFAGYNAFWAGHALDALLLLLTQHNTAQIQLQCVCSDDGQRAVQLYCTCNLVPGNLLAACCFTHAHLVCCLQGLLAGRDDIKLMQQTGGIRDINRHRYTVEEAKQEATRPVVQVRAEATVGEGASGV